MVGIPIVRGWSFIGALYRLGDEPWEWKPEKLEN